MKNLFAIVGSFASFWVLLFNCQGQVYQLTDLGARIGTNSYAQGINNQGQVVGCSGFGWEKLINWKKK